MRTRREDAAGTTTTMYPNRISKYAVSPRDEDNTEENVVLELNISSAEWSRIRPGCKVTLEIGNIKGPLGEALIAEKAISSEKNGEVDPYDFMNYDADSEEEDDCPSVDTGSQSLVAAKKWNSNDSAHSLPNSRSPSDPALEGDGGYSSDSTVPGLITVSSSSEGDSDIDPSNSDSSDDSSRSPPNPALEGDRGYSSDSTGARIGNRIVQLRYRRF